MPLLGSPNIEKLRAKGKVKALLRALHDARDPAVRRDAARALGQIGARSRDAARRTRAIEGLVAALRDEDRRVSKAAARGLSRVGAPSVRPLLSAFKGAGKSGRKASLKVIRQIGPKAVRPLGSVLRSGGRGMRKAALWILRRL
jgi:HEAT repeat protein